MAGFDNRDNTNNRPFAYINYILYDQDMVPVGGSSLRVPENAGSNEAELYIEEPQFKPVKFGFDEVNAIEVSQPGYIYIWLSNESKDTRVWFDDFTIVHRQNMVVQATDYGVWGDVIREQRTDESVYRYGYQGQYAEKDEETGWSHFELREYDPVIGRWLVPDPARQYFSAYVAFGNDPVNREDPDGGTDGDPDEPCGLCGFSFSAGFSDYRNAQRNLAPEPTGMELLQSFAGGVFDGVWDSTVGAISYAFSMQNVEESFKLAFLPGIYLAEKIESTVTAGMQIYDEVGNYSSTDWARVGGYATGVITTALVTKRFAGSVGSMRVPVYRVYGGASRINGFSWTPINPKLFTLSAYRRYAGLPNFNWASRYVKGSVHLRDIKLFRRALPLDGNPGGLPEFLINPENIKFNTHPQIFKSYWSR